MDVTLPNGVVVRGVPEGTGKAEIMNKAIKAGLATYQDFVEQLDPTDGMSGLDKFLAGTGKAFVDVWRGGRQLLTSDDSEAGRRVQAEIDESRRLDAPLMATGAGMTGNIAGNIAASVPLMALPGGVAAVLPRTAAALVPAANTVLGAGALGALTGALQPTATGESVLTQIGTGAAFGAGGQALGNAAPRLVKAVAAPFTRGGRDRLAAEVIERFATDPGRVAAAAGRQSAVPGVQYTLAEAAQDPGLAILERGVQNLDPAISGPLAEQQAGNIGALRTALQGIAGDDAAMAAAREARDSASAALYQQSDAVQAPVTPGLRSLFERPAVREAYDVARRNAANRGQTLPAIDEFMQGGTIDGRTLHTLKMAMDADISGAPARGISGDTASALRDARSALLAEVEDVLPTYRQAREAYAAGSRPINQMEVGRALYDKLVPALADTNGVPLPRTRAEAFAQALRNGDQTAQRATGLKGAKMADIMDADQMATVEGIQDYLARRAFTQESGRAAGTNTAQNLASGNLMRQMIGPLGLPESWADSVLSQSVRRGLDLFARPADAAIQKTLAEALMNPQQAADLLQRLAPTQRQQLVQSLYGNALTPASLGLGAYASQQ